MRARILDFVQTLRARAGVEVSVAESLDALVAVAAVGVEREPMREALAAALVKHEADRPAFDRLFDEAFPLVGGAEEGRRRRRARGAGGGRVPTGAGRGAGDGGRSRLRDEREERRERATHGHAREASPGAEARQAREVSGRESRAARARRLLALPFRELTSRDVEEARELVRELGRRLRGRLARRERRARRELGLRARAGGGVGGAPRAPHPLDAAPRPRRRAQQPPPTTRRPAARDRGPRPAHRVARARAAGALGHGRQRAPALRAGLRGGGGVRRSGGDGAGGPASAVSCLAPPPPLLSFLVSAEPFYLPIGDELALFTAAYECRLPVLLKGPTGCGKTRFVEYMARRLRGAADNGGPDGNLITVACHEDLTGSDLVGRYLIKGDETVWVDGPLTQAVKTGAICYLDEIVEARKDTTVLIHPLTDHRRILPIDKKGEILEAHPDFLLVISYNPGYQSVLKDLKHSTRQRFVTIDFDYAPRDKEAQVIAHESGVTMETALELAKLGEKVRHLKASGLEEGVSTRLLIYAGLLMRQGVPPRRACEVAVSRSLTDDAESQRAIGELAQAIFG